MRIIDADELQKVSIELSKKRILLVDMAPTVQAVPIEVLQEIRQEIADAKLPNDDEICKANNYGLNTALVIIDKHIAERSDKK